MRALSLAIVVVAGVAGQAVAQPAQVARALHRLELQARALDALTRRHPLSYELPFAPVPVDHEARDRFLAVCDDGDTAACWRAAMLEDWDPAGKARALVVEHCRAGDLPSCRALPLSRYGFESLPGRGGRDDSCRDPSVHGPGCDFALLSRECRAGFSQSCVRLRGAPDSEERTALLGHSPPIARAGCELGIENECNALVELDKSADAVELTRATLCPFRLFACQGVSEIYRQRHDRPRARDAAELLCQYGIDGGTRESDRVARFSICLDLASDYDLRVYPEPVPGRREALVAWVCADEKMAMVADVCVRRARKAARTAR